MKKELSIEARTENLAQVLAFVDEQLAAAACPPKAQMQIELAVDEFYVNIARYAYAPEVGMAEPTGSPYNPLAKKSRHHAVRGRAADRRPRDLHGKKENG